MSSDFASYFKHRGVSPETYDQYVLPAYLENRLPTSKSARILDFGCGFGQIVRQLKRRGYANAIGYDIEPTAIEFCQANGILIVDGNQSGLADQSERYDLILCSHVIEHIPKEQVIATLGKLRELLEPNGFLLVCVPNAQSSTGCYWAYEDFTHYTLYTSGSLFYVLSKAGFTGISFIDVDCTEGLSRPKGLLRKAMLGVYRTAYSCINRITSSATHQGSPNIFSYEIKACARR